MTNEEILRQCFDPCETQRPRWGKKTLRLRREAEKVVDRMRAEWPLSIRQIYYKLVGADVIPNNIGAYKNVTKIITGARINGFIPWDAIEDRTRECTTWRSWPNAAYFLSERTRGLTQGYSRDLLDGQPNAIEVWIEKSALAPAVEAVCSEFGVPFVVTRGYPSVTVIADFAHRARLAMADGKQPVIVLATDFDPSGANIGSAVRSSLKHDFGIEEVGFDRIMLTPEQVERHKLIVNPDAIKLTDTRARRFVERFGRVSVELDALDHETFRGIVREGIVRHLCLDSFSAAVATQDREREWLAGQSRRLALAINAAREEAADGLPGGEDE